MQTDGTLAPEVDWNTVDWKEGLLDKHTDPEVLQRREFKSVPLEDAEKLFERIKKTPEFQILPQVFKDLVEQNKENYFLFRGSGGVVSNPKFLEENSVLLAWPDYSKKDNNCNVGGIAWFNIGKLYLYIDRIGLMKFIDEPMETPAVNPKTKRPYVMPSKANLSRLSEEDLSYVKAFTETINRNIHYLGSTPIHKPDMKKIRTGAYIGAVVPALSLVCPEKLARFYQKSRSGPSWSPNISASSSKRLEREMERQKDYFAKGDKLVFELQNVLGTPLYNIRKFDPNLEVYGGLGDRGSCNGYSLYVVGKASPSSNQENLLIRLLIFNPIKAMATKNSYVHFILDQYAWYFEAVVDSVSLMRSGIKQITDNLDKKSPRYPAIAEVVKQANEYLTQIETNAAVLVAETSIKSCVIEENDRAVVRFIKNDVPETMLSAKLKMPKAVEKKSANAEAREKERAKFWQNKRKKEEEQSKKKERKNKRK